MKNGEKFVTVVARVRAFNRFCAAQKTCGDCPIPRTDADEVTACVLRWLDLEAEKEKPLPCPFCGRAVYTHKIVDNHTRSQVQCTCGYRGAWCDSRDEAIALHNRVARAVMEAKEGGEP